MRRVLLYDQKPDPRLLGFSDAASILGLSPYRTALDVWLRLVRGERGPGHLRMRRGQALEPLVIREALERLGEDRARWATQVGYQDETRPWLRCSLDAEREDGGRIIEAKTHNSAEGYGAEWTDTIPEHEIVQVVGYLHASGAAEAIHAVMVDDRIMLFRVLPHPELAALVIEAMERFWVDHVETGKPPLVEGSNARGIAKLYRGEPLLPSRRAAPEETAEVARYAELLDVRKHLQAEIDACESRLAMAIGPAKGLHDGWGRLSWSPVSGRTSWKEVAEELAGPDKGRLAELAEKHQGEESRRFYPSFKGRLLAAGGETK